MGSELFSKAVAKHQRTSTVSLNICERERKKKRKRGASSPLSHWLMWSSGYSSKVPFTHTCPASSHLTSYCAGLSKIISRIISTATNSQRCTKFFFLIVFGIGVKQVTENLFVRILFAYCWVEQTTLTWWSCVSGIYMHNLWHTSNAPTVYHEFSKILSILAAWSKVLKKLIFSFLVSLARGAHPY